MARYAIGGEVSGLVSGKSLVLRNNGGDDITQAKNGAFEFKTKIATGGAYNVVVQTAPSGQSCTVTNGVGKATGTVSNVKVVCADVPVVGGDTNAACYSMAQQTTGNVWTITSTGGTAKSTVIGPVSYRGHAAVKTHVENSWGVVADTYSQTTGGIGYAYGSVMTVPSLHETYYEPALSVSLNLGLNKTHTSSYNQITVQPGSPDYTLSVVHTATYRGRETITTAFGTFETCKMEFMAQESGGPSVSWTQWMIASGKLAGFSAQQASTDASGSVTLTQPTSIVVNW